MGLFFRTKKDDERKKREKSSVKEKVNEGKIHCSIIIEIAGRPVDYIRKALNLVLNGLAKEKGVEIISKKIHKPKKIQSIFSIFSEIEMITDDFKRLVDVAFDYMPSSIEIIAPQNFRLELSDANNLVNDLTMKLHKADAVAKRLGMENEIFRKQIEELKKGRALYHSS